VFYVIVAFQRQMLFEGVMGDGCASNQPSQDPVDVVEAIWAQSGELPDFEAFLAAYSHWSIDDLRTAVLVDQQFRSRTHQPLSAEQYAEMIPTLADNDDFTIDLLLGEFRGRCRQGQSPNALELSGRFLRLQPQLERQLEIAAWFEDDCSRDGEADVDDNSSETDEAGVRFGDYDLYEEIARGGMGVIFRARHRKLNRIVALKMIRPERLLRSAELQRFKNETQIISQLDHPSIIDILNVDQVDGIHFYTMRMVEGRDLESRRTEYLDDVRLAARLVSTVAAAIHYAHQHGVLHRDLKPSNVLVDHSGVPYVVDFGLASRLSEPSCLTPSVEFCGTPAYAAPELLQQQSLPASVAVDVYGLGAILYVLLTGQPPFSGRNSQEVWNKIRDSVPPPPRTLNAHIDPDLEAICLKTLNKNPAARYSSAAALTEDLDRYLAREPVTARSITWWQRQLRRLRKHPVGPALAIAAVVVVVGLLAVIAIQSIALQEQKQKTESIRWEADAYRQALEASESPAEPR
tara:strand:- start:5154 stop:6707 length:1554 start_codon:yes stop_codon:yes gene_type:complete